MMTTNAEVIRFLLECAVISDDKTPKEILAFLGTAIRLCDFDRIQGEFEKVERIDLSQVKNATDEQKKIILDYYTIWDAEIQIVLDYLEDNFLLIQ